MLRTSLLLFVLALTPSIARAQGPLGGDAPTSTRDSAPAAQSEPRDPVRLRFDLMGGVLAGSARGSRVSAGAATPAIKLDLGAQLGDHAALFARVEGGTILLASAGAAYVAAEWTPARAVSLGTGIGYDGMSLVWGGGCSATDPTCIRNSWSGISVPLFAAVTLRPRGAGASRGPGLRFEVEAAGGYDARTATWGLHGFVGIGGSWM